MALRLHGRHRVHVGHLDAQLLLQVLAQGAFLATVLAELRHLGLQGRFVRSRGDHGGVLLVDLLDSLLDFQASPVFGTLFAQGPEVKHQLGASKTLHDGPLREGQPDRKRELLSLAS